MIILKLSNSQLKSQSLQTLSEGNEIKLELFSFTFDTLEKVEKFNLDLLDYINGDFKGLEKQFAPVVL